MIADSTFSPSGKLRPPAGPAAAQALAWVLPLLAFCAVALLPVTPVYAATPEEAALERLFTEPPQADWFAPVFLAQVPVQQVELIIAQLTASLGAFEGVVLEGNEYLVHFATGILPAHVSLDAQGKIQGLFFQPPRPKGDSLDEIVGMLAALPGRTAVLVVSNQGVVAAHNAESPLAVASAFKLAVLAALKEEIDAGRIRWDDVVPLPREAKSLPTGILQDWPEGSPLTVHTLASLMISQSDNTATDALIKLLGREKIEAFAPRNVPFLTTREAFLLKAPSHHALLDEYRAAGADERRAVLERASDHPLPPVAEIAGSAPMALDVEWFFSAHELCELMGRVQGLPLMSINPGIASPDQWARVAYKGGSEPGVLSLVTALTAHDGSSYCVAAVWNNDASLNETEFFGMYAALLEKLAQR